MGERNVRRRDLHRLAVGAASHQQGGSEAWGKARAAGIRHWRGALQSCRSGRDEARCGYTRGTGVKSQAPAGTSPAVVWAAGSDDGRLGPLIGWPGMLADCSFEGIVVARLCRQPLLRAACLVCESSYRPRPLRAWVACVYMWRREGKPTRPDAGPSQPSERLSPLRSGEPRGQREEPCPSLPPRAPSLHCAPL